MGGSARKPDATVPPRIGTVSTATKAEQNVARQAARHGRDVLQADLSGRGFIVGGTSTGALLAAAVAIRARGTGMTPAITGQILRSPISIHPALASTYADPPSHST